jgi:flagellar protein FliO/FliZ
MHAFRTCWAIACAQLAPCVAFAADPPAAVGTGSILQVLLGLVVVLGMVFAAAWAMRVLLLEIDKTWLVVGVAPGRVSQIHSMPRPENFQAGTAPVMQNVFANWLKQTIEKRKNG